MVKYFDKVVREEGPRVTLMVRYDSILKDTSISKLFLVGPLSTDNVQAGLTISLEEVDFLIDRLTKIREFSKQNEHGN